MLTMRKLGKHGRFANQLFQYAFLRIASKGDYQCPRWVGEYLFGLNDPPVTENLPQIEEKRNYDIKTSKVFGNDNIDLLGFFQYHTSFYAQYKDFFRSLFQPTSEIREKASSHLIINHTTIGIQLRRGDYGTFRRKSARCFFVAPTEWYLDWLEEHWKDLDQPILFISSDQLEKVIDDFACYNPIVSYCSLPEAPFYPDFFALTQCDILLISNSSFGFAASMLNERVTECWRPRLSMKRLVKYDPWNSCTVFRDERYA